MRSSADAPRGCCRRHGPLGQLSYPCRRYPSKASRRWIRKTDSRNWNRRPRICPGRNATAGPEPPANSGGPSPVCWPSTRRALVSCGKVAYSAAASPTTSLTDTSRTRVSGAESPSSSDRGCGAAKAVGFHRRLSRTVHRQPDGWSDPSLLLLRTLRDSPPARAVREPAGSASVLARSLRTIGSGRLR
jgi:hypothetical protein